MRRLTLALLCATYLVLALIVSLTLWRNGGGWGAGVAALVGSLGLAFAFHGLIVRAFDNNELKVMLFPKHPVNSLGSFQETVILVPMTDELNADGQTGRSGKDGQGDARSVRPRRENIERGVARTGQSCGSLSGRTGREQQV